MPSVGALGRGGQTKAVGGQAHFGGVAVYFAGQVVDLVKYNQAPAIAQAVHVHIGAVVGGDGEVFDLVIAAAEQADLNTEGLAE